MKNHSIRDQNKAFIILILSAVSVIIIGLTEKLPERTGLYPALMVYFLAALSIAISVYKITRGRTTGDDTSARSFADIIFIEHPQNLLIIDPRDRRILDVNEAASESIGLSREKIRGSVCGSPIPSQGVDDPGIICFKLAEFTDGVLFLTNPQVFSVRNYNEETANDSELRNKHLFEDLPIPMYRSTTSGKLTAVNDAFRGLIGLPAGTGLEGINTNDFFIESIEREFLYERIRRDEVVKSVELHFRKIDGSSFAALVTAYACQDSSGEISMECSLVDITALKQLEKDRIKLEGFENRSKYMNSINNLAAGIAHDINNILAGIQGHAQVLHYKLEDNKPLHKSVDHITTAVKRADKIIEGLMTSIGAYDYHPGRFNLNGFVKDLLVNNADELSLDGRYRYIEMDSSIDILFDPFLFEPMILEIIKNAAAAGAGNEVIVTVSIEMPHDILLNYLTESEKTCACVSIIDKGKGMSPEVLDKIFEPYFTTESFGKGSGLGMTKVYGIIRKHEGAVGILTTEGEGTTVAVYLPI